jgi:hypothetical protein
MFSEVKRQSRCVSNMRDNLSPDTGRDRLVFVIRRSGRLQRVLDGCGISKADFNEVEKGLFKVSERQSQAPVDVISARGSEQRAVLFTVRVKNSRLIRLFVVPDPEHVTDPQHVFE